MERANADQDYIGKKADSNSAPDRKIRRYPITLVAPTPLQIYGECLEDYITLQVAGSNPAPHPRVAQPVRAVGTVFHLLVANS